MSSISTRTIKRALTSKGFREELTHHEMLWFFVDGKRTSLRTRISHGLKEYSDPLLAQMAKQLNISKYHLEKFFDCTLTEAEYLALQRLSCRVG